MDANPPSLKRVRHDEGFSFNASSNDGGNMFSPNTMGPGQEWWDPAQASQADMGNMQQGQLIPAFPSAPTPRRVSKMGDQVIGMYFRTKMCVRFKMGTCPNMDSCSFAHSAEELRKPNQYLEELASGGNMPVGDVPEQNQGSEFRRKFCKKFVTTGSCSFGDRCVFPHDENAAKSGQLSQPQLGVTGKPMNWRTRICVKWEEGSCPYGDKCHFAHGAHEIQPTGGIPPVKVPINPPLPPEPLKITKSTQSQQVQAHGEGKLEFQPISKPKPQAESTSKVKKSTSTDFQYPSNWKGPTDGISTIYGDWIEDFEWEESLMLGVDSVVLPSS